ncbi:alpha/beta hydrolase [Halpernia frigidisoli]|uniref:Pimeloyl-ACP methyl ester carboxylesterase n=1 Tax=Halpernia frigidisoli TaxID=1125876 RepID=A0A1I3D2N3_9FLAO|nr:alpha/beta hydrolase [Halpernia frigidisoli]SFH80789.1 Pimeloyl-ACP methyl ester carboxylesterase [Halpernia frigidisoli]
MSKKIFLISGLGADERMFHRLNFYNCTPVFIKWLPTKKNENIADYASRLLTQITEENPVIIGLSFGGIIAVEIAKQIKTEKIILISSAKDKSEIPFLYKFAAYFKLNKLIPKQLFKQTNFFVYWLFGVKNEEDKNLLKEVLKDTDLDFAVWAIEQIINWKNDYLPQNLHRIHGSNDHLLPLKVLPPDFEIENGSHLMVLNNAEEVSTALQEILN